jgi:NTP pyrophosphatase (non-canonical NTP hydrolase)
MDYFEILKERLRQFAAERDWERYHSPKNLAMALIVEAAELVEHFQWLTEEESKLLVEGKREEVSHELADILIYLVRLADMLEVDLVRAVNEKIAANARRYPPAGKPG